MRFNKDILIENRVEAVNVIHDYINKMVPVLLTHLKKGFSVKVDDTLFKKDADAVQKILRAHPIFRSILEINNYSITLSVDNTYRNSDHSCEYVNVTYYIPRDELQDIGFKPLPIYTAAAVTAKVKEVESKVNEISKIKDKINEIKSDHHVVLGGLLPEVRR